MLSSNHIIQPVFSGAVNIGNMVANANMIKKTKTLRFNNNKIRRKTITTQSERHGILFNMAMSGGPGV
jgi:hypothetical protein